MIYNNKYTTTTTKMKLTQQGLKDEKRIAEFMEKLGHRVVKSEPNEDRHEDIDYYIDNFAVSVKSQPTAAKTGNLCFELEVAARCSEDTEDCEVDAVTGQTVTWEKSTYYKEKAYYLILVKRTVYMVKYLPLRDYVDSEGWYRVTELAFSTRKQQQLRGHYHLNAKIGLVKLTDLLLAEVAVKLGELS